MIQDIFDVSFYKISFYKIKQIKVKNVFVKMDTIADVSPGLKRCERGASSQ